MKILKENPDLTPENIVTIKFTRKAAAELTERESHFYHVLSDAIIKECVERDVRTLAVSWPENVRDSDWGKTANKKLHTWAFDRLYQYLEYKGEALFRGS